MKPLRMKQQSGFTLLEVMVTMGILMTLVVGVATMLRSSIDVKQALARESRITHRLSIAANKISNDIEHAFITGLNEDQRGGAGRQFKTLFRIDKTGESDKLYMSITGYRPLKASAYRSDTAYIVYEVKDAKDAPGRKHLYRGVSLLTRDDLKDDPEMHIFVRNIKSIKVIPWTGDGWSNDRWDSSRGEWRDRMPHMVRLEIETWNEDDHEVTAESPADDRSAGNTVSIKTIVVIQQARQLKESKTPPSSPRWY